MGKNEFLLNTKDYCVLCLNRNSSKEVKSSGPGPASRKKLPKVNKAHSLHKLCRFLNLNLSEICENKSIILDQSELKGTLCSECGKLNGSFTKYFAEMELVKMRLLECLKSISKRIVIPKEEDGQDQGQTLILEQFRNEMLSQQETLAQFGIVEKLRRKTLEKSYQKLTGYPPFLKVPKVDGEAKVVVQEISQTFSSPIKMDVDVVVYDDGNELLDYAMMIPFENVSTVMEPEQALVECDLCHLKVTDLFTHLATAHSETRGEGVNANVNVVGRDRDQKSGFPPPPTVFVPNKGHTCDLCGSTFTQRGSLNRHRQKIHFGNILKSSGAVIRLDQQERRNTLEGRDHHYDNRIGNEEEVPIDFEVELTTSNPTFSNDLVPPSQESSDVSNSSKPKCIVESKTGRVKCLSCLKDFKEMSGFHLHYNSTHLKIRYECPICGKEFNHKGSFQRHHQTAHVSGRNVGSGVPAHDSKNRVGAGVVGVRHKCLKCNKSFKLKVSFIKHQKWGNCQSQSQIQGQGYGISGIIGNKSSTKLKKVENVKKNVEKAVRKVVKANFRCQVCGKGFVRSADLRRHFKLLHLNMMQYQCQVCGKSFKYKLSYTKHLETDHQILKQQNGGGGSGTGGPGDNLIILE